MKVRYKIFIVLVICILFSLIINKVCYADEEEYIINSEKELKEFAEKVNNGNTFEGKIIKLMEDINLNGSENNQWTPIGTVSRPFKGTFEGNGHVVNGIYINDKDLIYSSFFGYNYGKIQNLGVSGTIEGGKWTAGICAYNLGTIYKCYNAVNLSSKSINIGGIVAWNRLYR